MLAGLAAALVPWILHLLNRARYRNVDWGAMMFLEGPAVGQLRSAPVKQWVLLLLRSLILGLLAVALAHPVLHARGLPPQQPGRSAAVIMLDRSASMGMNDNGRLRLDAAREAVFQLLSPGFRPGDDLWLVPLGERDPAVKPAYASDPREMANIVKELTRPSGQADVAAGLREAIDLLASAEAPNREVYIVCDRQSNSWRNVDEAFVREWRAAVARLPRPPRVFVLPVGTEESGNVAVAAIVPARLPLVVDQPVDVEVRLHNFGATPRASVPVTVHLDGAAKPIQRTVNFPARGDAVVIVSMQPTESGSHLITASIEAPGSPADRRMELSVDVLKELRVLLVDGDEQDGSPQSGADFLSLALSPYPKGSKRNTALVSTARTEAWGAADLHGQNVLILANVPTVTEAQADAALQFVYGGGGLIVAPGDQTRPDNCNALMPWLPAELKTPIADGAGSTTLGQIDLAHPMFRFLGGKPETAPAAIRRYFPAVARHGAATLGSYADGRPFILEAPTGRGRTLLLTTPFDTDWNALPLTHFFLPFVQSAVHYAASGPSTERMARRNLLPGQALVADFEESLDPQGVAVQLWPYLRRNPADVSISQSGAGAQVRYGRTFEPGVYSVWPHGAVKGRPSVQFVVRTPADESDLTAITEARWRDLERDLNFQRIDPDRRSPAVRQELAREGMDLWLPILGAAIVLSMIELSATRRWAGERT